MAHPYDPREHRELERYGEAREFKSLEGLPRTLGLGDLNLDQLHSLQQYQDAARDALRAEGAAAEREKIRAALLHHADRLIGRPGTLTPAEARNYLKDFADTLRPTATLEKP